MNSFIRNNRPHENIHFQIYSSEDYFIDLTFTFIDLHVNSVALAIEKLRAGGNNIKLLFPHAITINDNFLRDHVPTPNRHLSMAKFLQNLLWPL